MPLTCPADLQDSPKERLGASQNCADTSQLSSLSNTPYLWWATTHFKQGHRSSAFPGLPDGSRAAPCYIPVLFSRTQSSPTTADTLCNCSIQKSQPRPLARWDLFPEWYFSKPFKRGEQPPVKNDSPQHGLSKQLCSLAGPQQSRCRRGRFLGCRKAEAAP